MITFIKKYKGMLLKAYILINNINIYTLYMEQYNFLVNKKSDTLYRITIFLNIGGADPSLYLYASII